MAHAEEAQAPFPEGTMLNDKYRLDSLLAVGGMGAVYAGVHLQLEKRVAIKVLRKEFCNSPELIERFQREAIAASRIGHENIVEVTDIGAAFDDSPFIVMEFLEGHDLSHRIERDGPTPFTQAAVLVNEILSAIGAAHAVGIIHRDLKPENVFLQTQSRGEKVKIVDFGISRMTATEDANYRLTVSGLVMGTPHYMAPEQACGASNITFRADIYAIGVILYELVTAKVPFKATNYNALMFKVISGEFPAPTCFASMPPEFEKIVLRAMALEPADRFASAEEFAQHLAPYVPLQSQSSGGLSFSGSGAAHTPRTGAESVAPTLTLSAPSPASADNAKGEDSYVPPATSNSYVPPATSKRRMVLIAGAALVVVVLIATLTLLNSSQSPAEEKPGVASKSVQVAQATITFALSPKDAVVAVDGVNMSEGELVRPLSDATLTISVSRDGYITKERVLSLDKSREIEIILQKEAPALEAPLVTDAEENKRKRKPVTKKKRKKVRKNKRIISDSPYD